jgi:hypothetical protein
VRPVENNFEAGISRVEVCDAFTSQSPLKKSVTPTPEKPDLKPLSDFKKKISWSKSRPFPTTFLLAPKGFEKFLKFS